MEDLNLPTHLPTQAPQHLKVSVQKQETNKGKEEKKSIPVFGTNIVLETEEDIKKWIEERKRKYPTKKRLEEKEIEQESKKRQRVNKKDKNEEKTKSLVPKYDSQLSLEGHFKVIDGFKTWVPKVYVASINVQKEKRNFNKRIWNKTNEESNKKILAFLEDLFGNGWQINTEALGH